MISKKYDTRVHSLLWRGVCQEASCLCVLAFLATRRIILLLLLFSSPLFSSSFISFSDLFSLIPFVFWLALLRFLALFIISDFRVGFYLISFSFLSSAILMYYFCVPFLAKILFCSPYIFNVVMPESLG